jgi:hypothetical protein
MTHSNPAGSAGSGRAEPEELTRRLAAPFNGRGEHGCEQIVQLRRGKADRRRPLLPSSVEPGTEGKRGKARARRPLKKKEHGWLVATRSEGVVSCISLSH